MNKAINAQSKGYEGLKLLEDILSELNKHFDPEGIYPQMVETGNNLFHGSIEISGNVKTHWEISFLGYNIFDSKADGSENELELVEKNRPKITIFATNRACDAIKTIMYMLSKSDVSETNKKEWISIIENKDIEKDDVK